MFKITDNKHIQKGTEFNHVESASKMFQTKSKVMPKTTKLTKSQCTNNAYCSDTVSGLFSNFVPQFF